MERLEELKRCIRIEKIKETPEFDTYCRYLYSFLYRYEALGEFIKGGKDRLYDTSDLIEIINKSMVWCDTTEGHDYWKNVHLELLDHFKRLSKKDPIFIETMDRLEALYDEEY